MYYPFGDADLNSKVRQQYGENSSLAYDKNRKVHLVELNGTIISKKYLDEAELLALSEFIVSHYEGVA